LKFLKKERFVLMQTLQAPSTTQATPAAGTRKRQVVATLLGARQFEQIDWRRLMQDGVLVRVHIAGSNMFWTQLTYEDLGIRIEQGDMQATFSRWMTLGKKRLLPEAYMQALSRIESKARYALKERSFRTELGAFVPSTAYVAWRDTTRALRDQYFALRDDILANHATLARQVLGEYEAIASNTYERLRQAESVLLIGRDQFVAAYCQRIAAQIPSPDRIREKFDFKYLLLDGLSQVSAAAEQTEEQEAVSPEMIETARNEVEQRAWQRSVLEQDLRAHAQERVSAMLDDFLSSVVGHLRVLTYDATCDVLATLQRHSNERLSPRSIVQLNNLLAQIRSLNFYGDADIDQMMTRIEQMVEQTPQERQASLADIQRILHAIATTTRATLLDLGEEPRSARILGIPDYPTDSTVRQARAEIGLDLDPTQLAALAQTRAEARASRAEVNQPSMESLWVSLQDHDASRASRAV
jgi:hypothetical protein